MAPKNKIEKQQLIDAAFKIASNEGLNKITIRKVADELGCSIAPIYVNFSDVESLKQAVQEKAVELMREIAVQQDHGDAYLNRGIANLIFASRYPLLFYDVILNLNPRIYSKESDLVYLEQVRNDPEIGKLSEDQLRVLMYRLYVFHIGLVVLSANELHSNRLPLDEAIRTLEETGYDIIAGMVQRLEKTGKEGKS